MNVPLYLLLGLATLILSAALMTLMPSRSKLGRGRLIALDGLRGYLALMVFVHHYSVTFIWKTVGRWTVPPRLLNDLGVVAVAIFFMITGFLFTGKVMGSSVNWKNLYISRVFRIYPLYLLAVIVIAFTVAAQKRFRLEEVFTNYVWDLTRWLIFCGSRISGFSDTRFIIAGVDWTLRYEWMFYISLPLVHLIWVASKKSMSVVVIACLLVTAASACSLTLLDVDCSYFVLFIIGGICNVLFRRKALPWIVGPIGTVLAVSSLVLAFALPLRPGGLSQYLLLGLFFCPVALGNDLLGVLSKSYSVALGRVSYGIYLLHGAVLYLTYSVIFPEFNVRSWLYLLMMPVLGIVVVLAATFVNTVCEEPMIRLGKRAFAQTKEIESRAAEVELGVNAGG